MNFASDVVRSCNGNSCIKTVHLVGELFGKILFFLKKRNKEKLMKGFEVIMTRVSTASLPSPSLPPKMETRNKDRAKP